MENKDKRIPKYCFEIPLSGVDYIYQSSFSHSPVVVMKPLVQPLERISEETKKLKCMKCGRTAKNGESFNSNKDGSFIECDDCMWKVEPLQNGERERVEQILDYYVTKSDCYTYNSIVSQKRRKMLKSEIEDLLSQSKKEGRGEALEEINKILGTNIKYVNGEYKVVFRELSKLTTK